MTTGAERAATDPVDETRARDDIRAVTDEEVRSTHDLLTSIGDVDVVVDLRDDDAVVIEIEQRTTEIHRTLIEEHEGLLGATPTQLFVKRALDVVGASVAIVLTTPLLLAVAAAIKLTSPGPILYRSSRVGTDGRVFQFLKFRSMIVDADNEKPSLVEHNEVDGPVFKMQEDPRITPVGRILRRYSIDEIPQFLHVLSGKMSLVGPRPPIPEEIFSYDMWQLQRLLVKPGVTCIWQVSGRSTVDFETWMEMDLEYIRNWTLLEDLKLLAKTPAAVLSARGAF